MEKGYLWYKGAHQRISAIDRQGSVGIRRKRGRDGLIRKEGAREIKNRGPTSPRIVTTTVLFIPSDDLTRQKNNI